MKAKVLSVEPNKTFTKRDGSGTYTALSLITQGEPYKGQEKEPREHRMFANNPLFEKASKLQTGMWIEYKCDNSKFKNMESFEIIGQGDGGASTSTATDSFVKDNDSNKSAAIARAVAIKAAVDTLAAMIGKDMIKKSAKPEFVALEVINMSRFFETYLTFEDVSAEEESTEDSLEGADDDLD